MKFQQECGAAPGKRQPFFERSERSPAGGKVACKVGLTAARALARVVKAAWARAAWAVAQATDPRAPCVVYEVDVVARFARVKACKPIPVVGDMIADGMYVVV